MPPQAIVSSYVSDTIPNTEVTQFDCQVHIGVVDGYGAYPSNQNVRVMFVLDERMVGLILS